MARHTAKSHKIRKVEILVIQIIIEIKSYNTVFIRIKIAIILLTFILIGISSYIKLKSYKS